MNSIRLGERVAMESAGGRVLGRSHPNAVASSAATRLKNLHPSPWQRLSRQRQILARLSRILTSTQPLMQSRSD